MKRIVFEGAIPQIVGVVADDLALPVTVGEFFGPSGEAVPFASLVRVTTRAAYYRAPMVPKSYGSFDPRQQ